MTTNYLKSRHEARKHGKQNPPRRSRFGTVAFIVWFAIAMFFCMWLSAKSVSFLSSFPSSRDGVRAVSAFSYPTIAREIRGVPA